MEPSKNNVEEETAEKGIIIALKLASIDYTNGDFVDSGEQVEEGE